MKKNALQLMQELRDYFKDEYGLEVDVAVFAHDHVNQQLTGENALALATKLQPELRCKLNPWEHDGSIGIRLEEVGEVFCSPLKVHLFASSPVPPIEEVSHAQHQA